MKIKTASLLVAIAGAALAGPAAGAQDLPFADVQAVDAANLGEITGQADLNQQVTSNNTSTVSNNSVNGTSVTGGINFDSQSFQNMSGLTVLSANTGNNVAINAALNVNVSLHP